MILFLNSFFLMSIFVRFFIVLPGEILHRSFFNFLFLELRDYNYFLVMVSLLMALLMDERHRVCLSRTPQYKEEKKIPKELMKF